MLNGAGHFPTVCVCVSVNVGVCAVFFVSAQITLAMVQRLALLELTVKKFCGFDSPFCVSSQLTPLRT